MSVLDPQETPPDARSVWLETAEELRTAEEELRTQNDELVLARETIEAERQRYRELFESAPDGYLVTDADAIIRDVNRAALALLRVPARFIVGKPLGVFVHPTSHLRWVELLRRVDAGQPVQGEELTLRPRDAEPFPAAVHVNVGRDSDGRLTSIRWMLHDRTALHRTHARLVQAERLAAVGQAIAALAHESRGGLQRVQACLRLLSLEVEDRPEGLKWVDRGQHALNDLRRLFDDAFALAVRPTLQCAACSLRDLWRDAWGSLGGTGTLSEVVECDPTCTVDPLRLGQVFRNLFENSLAIHPTAHVTVRCTDADLAGRPAIRCVVSDDGPGFSDETWQRLFEPFFTTRPNGTGLGLALVRQFIEGHSGFVLADNAPTGGAMIEFVVPRGGT